MQTICHVLPIVNTIFKISQKHNKHYCYPSQKTIQKKLADIYGINRSIPTINRWLRVIEDQGLLKRVRRGIKMIDGRCVNQTTMYFLQLKGLKKLNQMGYDVWDVLKAFYDKVHNYSRDEKKLVEEDKNWAEVYKAIKEYPKKIKEKLDAS